MTNVLARSIIDISYRNNLSHVGSCLTTLPILEEIYAEMKEGERVVLSNGHAHLAHLVIKEKYGLVNAEEAVQKWGIHCDRLAGCDVSTGSLGSGLPIAVGLALADRSKFVYCIISDGECSEGSIMESLRIAKEQRLTNLKVYVNVNGWGAFKKIDPQEVVRQLKPYEEGGAQLMVILTSSDITDTIKQQAAHYQTISEEEYNSLQ